MHILVTGATGRIGSHLTKALIREGHTVRALALPDDPRAEVIAGPAVEIVYGRLEDAGAINAAVPGVDAVFHLAAALTSRENTDEEFFEFNLLGTFNLLMAIRAQAPQVQRVLYASSDAVYYRGPAAGACYLPVDEAHPRLAGSVYGASKIGAEELCLTFWRGFGIPTTILRFGGTADAEELVNPRSVFARWLFLPEMIRFLSRLCDPSPAQKRSLAILQELDDGTEKLVSVVDEEGNTEIQEWGDARDVAQGCVQALNAEAAVGEAFNLGGVAPFALDRLVRHIGDRLDLPCVTAQLPIARSAWYISSAKARGMLGYDPQHTVFDMVDEAAADVRIERRT